MNPCCAYRQIGLDAIASIMKSCIGQKKISTVLPNANRPPLWSHLTFSCVSFRTYKTFAPSFRYTFTLIRAC